MSAPTDVRDVLVIGSGTAGRAAARPRDDAEPEKTPAAV